MPTTVKINNNEKYELNSMVPCISLGYSMKSKYKITKCYLMQDDSGMFVREGKIDSVLFPEDLNKYYLDTKENRKLLKAIIEQKNNA